MTTKHEQLLSLDQLLKILEKQVSEAGSQLNWATQNNVSRPHLNDVLKRNRAPGAAVLNPLGYERVVLYRKKQS